MIGLRPNFLDQPQFHILSKRDGRSRVDYACALEVNEGVSCTAFICTTIMACAFMVGMVAVPLMAYFG